MLVWYPMFSSGRHRPEVAPAAGGCGLLLRTAPLARLPRLPDRGIHESPVLAQAQSFIVLDSAWCLSEAEVKNSQNCRIVSATYGEIDAGVNAFDKLPAHLLYCLLLTLGRKLHIHVAICLGVEVHDEAHAVSPRALLVRCTF